jgi:GH15 family glucan-1,4-alpha-glucosidase
MALRIEDYGVIGDTQTAALVGANGSMDWLCLPRFDSGACFAGLLGGAEHGHWRLAPAGARRATRRCYWRGTLVLESEYETPEGRVRVLDFMPPRGRAPDVVRIVEGVAGRVPMRMRLVIRFDYGQIVPWVRQKDGVLSAVGGPDGVCLRTPVETRGENLSTVAQFEVEAGERVPFVLTWHPSHEPLPPPIDPEHALADTEAYWRDWAARYSGQGEWVDEVRTSLLVLKALTYAPTGGIVAAATTSLPEAIAGVRNWDYRYCWLRDATFTLLALLAAGYDDEAVAWRDWLLRAVAGDPADLQIMYGVAGERRLTEQELGWLPGYERSRPVRIGNAASTQLQLDVYGEVMDALHQGRSAGQEPDPAAWALQRHLLDFLESGWREPDEGLWEVRGGRRHFTHSKVMAWVAFDRAVQTVERLGRRGPVDRWRRIRQEIHDEVTRNGFDAERGAFVQSFGSKRLDASLLLLPIVGFLPPDDPRVVGTVEAIQRELCHDGFVLRYATEDEPAGASVDGLPGREGAFLACSFWLCDALTTIGRVDDARQRFERLLAVRNDLGLLAEEYDPVSGRQLGNFPQAFSHVGLVNTALNLTRAAGPADRRREDPAEARR